MGLERMRHIGNDYMRRSFYRPDIKTMEYDKDRLAIGVMKNGRIYYLDLSEACRIALLGATRSGKTWILREMMDRLQAAGRALFFATDIKDELKSSVEPVQRKFHSLLLPTEQPKPMKIVSLRPTFFRSSNMYNKLPQRNVWYSPDMNKMTKMDFMTLVNSDKLTVAQLAIMENLYTLISRVIQGGQKFHMAMISSCLDQIEISDASRMALNMRFNQLYESDFQDDSRVMSLPALIKKGYVPSLNMMGFESYMRGYYLYPQAVVGMALSEILNARRLGQIPPIFIMMDESVRFIGNDIKTSVKDFVMESVDVDTKFGVNYVFVTQVLSKLPEEITKQCRYVFIPGTCDVDTIKDCLMNTGQTRYIQRAYQDSVALKNAMMGERYLWTIIDRTTGTREIIRPLPPLSNHMETERE